MLLVKTRKNTFDSKIPKNRNQILSFAKTSFGLLQISNLFITKKLMDFELYNQEILIQSTQKHKINPCY